MTNAIEYSKNTAMKLGRTRTILSAIPLALPLVIATSGIVACESLREGRPNLAGINSPTVSGDPCKSADWFEVGRIDGLNGVSLEYSTYAGRCKAKGHAVDLELYNAGWQRGLIDYCTPERAYDAGRASESYDGICPKNLEAKFLKRYKVGIEIAALEKKNAAIEGIVDRKISELAAMETMPAADSGTRSTILDDALSRTPAEKANPDLAQKKSALRSEIQHLRDDLARNANAIQELEKSSL